MQIERRKFLESACKACLLAGAGFLISDLTACSPSAKVLKLPITQNTVRMPVTAFANEPLQIVRPDGWLYDIAVRKTSADEYEALLMQCTHQKNQLMAESGGFICSLHGSRFTIDGQVRKGPAELPLKKFTTSLDQGQLIILIKS
jgi:Rieske Fe-S protein